MRQIAWGASLALSCLLLSSCFDEATPPPDPTPTASPTPSPTATPAPASFVFDFGTDGEAWTAGFADYADEQADLIDFDFGVRQLPAPLEAESGYLLAGTNRSDDLTTFAWRKVENLVPNQSYSVAVELTIASNVPTGCFGVGGSPGDSVYVKAGAAGAEPAVAKDEAGSYRVSVDQGQQAQGGTEATVLGTIGADGAGSCDAGVYAVKTFSPPEDLPVVKADAAGSAWLWLSTDSAFESRTAIYLLDATFSLTPS